jgi:uncharacterized protein YcbX
MRLSGLFIYPVKALRGIAVDSAEVDALGLVGDRRFLVVDETGKFLTQRSHARMALVDTALSADTLTLYADGAGAVRVPRAADPAAPSRTVEVWRSKGLLAEDCGDAPAKWLSDFLALRVRLVRIGETFRRPVLLKSAYAAHVPADAPKVEGRIVSADVFNFADGYPFMVISEASLADLNDRLAERDVEPLPWNRFRPNLVVSGCAALAEDAWSRVRIGGLVLRSAGLCARCVVTTIDQLTTEQGHEPLRTLASYRRDAVDPTNVNFGLNLVHETKRGTLRVGDAVTVL